LSAGLPLTVWYAETGALAGHADRLRGLLSPPERERLDRMVAGRRDGYLLAHGLLRLALAHDSGVAAAAWELGDTGGQPQLRGPAGAPAPRVSLSHTAGLVACAIADADVGVDVEDRERRVALVDLADRYFAAAEAADVRARGDADRRARFFEYWTLKEAYAKARGAGLSLPLDQIRFAIDGDATVAELGPALADRGGDWTFVRARPTARHQLAAAVRSGGRPVTVRIDDGAALLAGPG